MIPYLLNVEERYRAWICIVLGYYRDIFPGALPTLAPPNQKLGDIHKIPIVEGTKPKRKSMYRHSP